MALTALQTFRRLASVFAKYPDDQLNEFLELAASEVDPDVFGDEYTKAAVYLAAHFAEIDRRTRAGHMGSSRVTSQTKDVIGYAPQLLNVDTSDEALRSTPFGYQFLRIRNKQPATAPRVIRSTS